MLAKINGLFRLTRDSELSFLSNGTAMLKMGIANSEKYKDKETKLFLDAIVFGKPAEIINQYAGNKGTQIFLSGKLQTETWETDGQKKSKISMVVESWDFVNNNTEPQSNAHTQKHTDYQQKQQAQRNMPNTLPQIDINEDEIPF